MRCAALVEVGADEGREMRRRAAGVAGGAGAVLAGQHPAPQRRPGQDAEPERGARGEHLGLDRAVEQGVLHLGRRQRRPAGHGPLPGRRLRGLPAGVVRHPDVRRAARATPRSRAPTGSPRRGSGRSRRAPARGRRGRPRAASARRRGSASRWPREALVTRSPVRREMPALVAITSSSRATTSPRSEPSSDSESPSAYPAAVSTSVPPASTNDSSCSRASCSSVSRPQVIVPRPSRET